MSDSHSLSCVNRLQYAAKRNGVSFCLKGVVLLDAWLTYDSLRDIVCQRVMQLGRTFAVLDALVACRTKTPWWSYVNREAGNLTVLAVVWHS